MRSRLAAVLAALLMIPLVVMPTVGSAAPGDGYYGPYFGDGNLPPGCIRDMSQLNENNVCYHMRTDLNGLDSPQIDVLIVVPVSPTAERDMRIMRQSIEMWEGGIGVLAEQMDLDWLADGVDFHITVHAIDPNGDMGEFTTYPVVDPEIVVIATNPVGGIGIGIDPVDFSSEIINIFGPDTTEDEVPCHSIQNPLDFDYWDSLPGFNNHHGRSGTYVEDCGGAGGNVCFAVNGAIDPEPSRFDFFQLFDLVSHEVGHCLTLGHVGDGAEGDWGTVPVNDIMAYDEAPHGLTKCVSTLDVETFATRMSKYLDVNGDGTAGDHTAFADGGDLLTVNDVPGDGRNPFQVQHPRDHRYASSTGSPLDCPQPDTGLVPGERVDWSPEPVATSEPRLTVTDAAFSEDDYRVAGYVEHASLTPAPTSSTGTVEDPDDDATTPQTEITSFDVEVTDTHVTGTLHLAEVWPVEAGASAVSYSVVIDGRKFDSYVRAGDTDARTYDTVARQAIDSAATWDAAAGTVAISIPRTYLDAAGIDGPYEVLSQTNITYTDLRETHSLLRAGEWIDDRAPDPATPVVVLAPGATVARVPLGLTDRITQTHTEQGVYYTEESTLGFGALLAELHEYRVPMTGVNDVSVTLAWEDTAGGSSDLDLFVTGGADSGSGAATSDNPEVASFTGVTGDLNLLVDPFLVVDPAFGAEYTLTVEVTCTAGCDGEADVDSDGDGLFDGQDACPTVAGYHDAGCPPPSGTVVLTVDGEQVATQDVSTYDAADVFDFSIAGLSTGSHEVTVAWIERGTVLASETFAVVGDDDGDGVPNDEDICEGHDDAVDTDGDGTPDGCDTDDRSKFKDKDGDGVSDDTDNCKKDVNADQADMDGDGDGDVCDNDIDGDGIKNKKEEKHGSDPYDPESVPTKGKASQA